MSTPAFQRALVADLCHRMSESHFRLVMVIGPRQSGKTTIARQALSRLNAPNRYVAVDDPETLPVPAWTASVAANLNAVNRSSTVNTEWLVDVWARARYDAERLGEFVLVLDEIQYVRNWSATVKGLWDADRRNGSNLRVVLLGSAPMRIQQGLQESLVGRFSVLRVPHWSYQEMNLAFGVDIAQYMYFGGFPGVFAGAMRQVEGIDFASRWSEYVLEAIVNPIIDRDILAMADIRKPALMRTLVNLCSEYSGQILSFNKMLGQLTDAGNTTTLANYLQLLQSVGLFAGLQGFGGSPHRRRGTSPKLIALNPALMTSSSGYSYEQAKADRTYWGRIVESAVGAHLINTASLRTKVFYWRYRNAEVDFVLQRGPQLIGIEVAVPGSTKNTRHLVDFANQFDQARTLLVGADGISLDKFLSRPADAWFDD